MSRSRCSTELPPKVNYAERPELEREILIRYAMQEVRAEFQLYERTKNGAHMWRCYQLWQRLMPDDLALPRELAEYFDMCAEAVATITEPGRLKNAMQLNTEPQPLVANDRAERGGGRSGATAAEAPRRQRNAMEFVRAELLQARIRGASRGYKTAIYKKAAKKFDYHVSRIKQLVSDWSVSEIVERDFRDWQAVDRKDRRLPRM